MITNLTLKNFLAFTNLNNDLSPGINIIIGENGTGKTQLLKAILALSGTDVCKENINKYFTHKLCRLYDPLDDKVGGLRREGKRGEAVLNATFSSAYNITVKFNGKATEAKVAATEESELSPAIFIPTKEVLSLARGLTKENPHIPTIERIFDDGYLDLANLLIKEDTADLQIKVKLDPRFASIIPNLTNLIGGRYLLKNGRFIFETGYYEDKPTSSHSKAQHAQMYQDSSEWKFIPYKKKHLSSIMTAEGFRKIGILQRLLSNGSLKPGITGPLLWDEPESNLNPKLIKDLVQVLLELSRNNQQIILATHDYVLLKWFDLLLDKGKGDQILFHRLYQQSINEDIQSESLSDYNIVARSAISNTFAELYDEDVKRALGEE